MRYPKSEVAEILERFVRAEGRVSTRIRFNRVCRPVHLRIPGLARHHAPHLLHRAEFTVELGDDMLADPSFSTVAGISSLVAGLADGGLTMDLSLFYFGDEVP